MAAKCFCILAAALPLLFGCSSGDDDQAVNGAGGGGSGTTAATSGAGNIANGGSAGGAPAGAAGGGMAADDALVVPADVMVMPLSGGTGDLTFVALTLSSGPDGIEAYAALRNSGDMAACSGGLTLQLYDKNQQPLGANIGGLLSQHLYRFTDGSNTVAACIGPGDLTMATVGGFSPDIALEDVGFVVYSSTYFALDVTPIDGFTVTQVQSVTNADGTSFTGTFTNGFDMTIDSPSVAVFPVNRVGRPLALATATGMDPLLPGGTWTFETDAVDATGSDSVAYPTAAVP